MKKTNGLILWSNILTTFFLISLLSFIFCPSILSTVLPSLGVNGETLGGNVFMIIGAAILVCGTTLGWIAYAFRKKQLCLVSNIVCNIGEILSLGFFFFFIPSIVLGYIGFAKQKKWK